MLRREDDLGRLVIDIIVFHMVEQFVIFLIDGFADQLHVLIVGRLIGQLDIEAVFNHVDILVDPVCFMDHALVAIVVVDFEPIVFLGIVARSDHYSGKGLELLDRERQFRRRTQVIEKVDLDVVVGQHDATMAANSFE